MLFPMRDNVMNDYALMPEEQVRLVEAIIDDFGGCDLSRDDFQERIGLLCEDIPGLECLPEEQFARLVAEAWSLYRALTSDDESGDGSPWKVFPC
jgi:hypothetical protein